MWSASRARSASSHHEAPPTQFARVERLRSTPWRAKICDWRYSGRWSQYLLTSCPSHKFCPPQKSLVSRPMSVGKNYMYAYGQLLQETSVVRADGINGMDKIEGTGQETGGTDPRQSTSGNQTSPIDRCTIHQTVKTHPTDEVFGRDSPIGRPIPPVSSLAQYVGFSSDWSRQL